MGKASKRSRSNFENGVLHMLGREVGELPPRAFAQHLGVSEDLVLRLDICKKLAKHTGCVNTVSFSADGEILISGSDDRLVMLWDWDAGIVKLSFHSGHVHNIFQAKIMPFTNNQSIVTCAADGQVRHAQILEGGQVETVMLAKHQGRAHKLAIDPGSPYNFFSCGEDGLVRHFDLRVGAAMELFTCRSLHDKSGQMRIVHLNAMTIDPTNPNVFIVAGSDEYARLYDIRKYKHDGSNDFGQSVDHFCPPHLIGNKRVVISAVTFSDTRELLVSYNGEHIYLFTKDMGLGCNPVGSNPISVASPLEMDADYNAGLIVYKGHRNRDTFKNVTFFGPNTEYVMSGSDCGRVFIWKKGGELLRVMNGDKHVVNLIEPHPHITSLASSGIEHDIKIWTPEASMKASLPMNLDQVFIPDRIAWIAIEDSGFDDEFDKDDEILSDSGNDDSDNNDATGMGDGI